MRAVLLSINTMNTVTRSIGTICFVLTILLAEGWTPVQPSANKIIEIGRFSKMDVDEWLEKSFAGNTQYTIRKLQNVYVLQATAKMSASAYYKRVEVNLQETPFLNWSWLIEFALPALNEQSKQGDDYAARIYVVIKTGLAPWNTRALNYVWSSNDTPAQSWPNAFTNKAIMIPLRARKDSTGEWKMEKVNVQEDIKKYLGANINKIDGIAIMSDTDNSGNTAIAHYGDIFFSNY